MVSISWQRAMMVAIAAAMAVEDGCVNNAYEDDYENDS